MRINVGESSINKNLLVIFVFLLIFASLLVCAPCKAETDNQKSFFRYSTSVKPDYVIAFEKGDYKTAIKEMRSLAEKGDPYAQYNLGLLYYKGSGGLAQNYKEAEKWWRKSAEQKLLAAISGLATIYQDGKETNRKESFEWYRKAAERNEVIAQYFLGAFYDDGYGVAKDYKEAAKWYRKAADNGERAAPLRLGYMYEKGIGVPQNQQEAFKLYRMAAVRDVINAQILLGTMYFKGQGVAQDYVQAYKWFYIASTNSDKRHTDTAQKAIKLTEKHINQKQIAEAIRLAKEEKITKSNDIFEKNTAIN